MTLTEFLLASGRHAAENVDIKTAFDLTHA